MRKAIITVAVATALFAVGAFAASFTVQSEDIASGANAVEACAKHVSIEFDELVAPVDEGADFTVEGATATFHNGTLDNPIDSSECNGFSATLSLTIDGTPTTFTTIDTIDGGAVSFDLTDVSGVGVAVGPISAAAVAVEGKFLPSTFTPAT